MLFHGWTRQIVSTTATAEQRAAVMGGLRDYVMRLVAAKADYPGDDLLSRLVARYQQAGLFDRETLAGVALTLLIAGHETTANMIALGVVGLLENPGQLAALLSDPSLMHGAVEELVRYFPVVDYATSRVAADDIEVAGVLIRRGEGIIAPVGSANRDPRAFPDPDILDIHRNAHGHLSFGYGIHQCLGQNLARLELEIVYSTLFARIPGLRLAVPVDELPFKHDANVYGVHRLPVTW
jgi:cytochrome P450